MSASADVSDLLVRVRGLATRGAWPEVRALLAARAAAARSHAELIALHGEAMLRTRAPADASAWLAAAAAVLRRAGDRAAIRRAMNLQGAAHFELGELDAAEERFQRAVELARGDGDDLLVARTTNNLGAIANVRGDHGTALSLYRLAIPAYQRLGNARGLGETYHNVAITLRDLGDDEGADESECRALEYALQAEDSRLAAMAMVGRADLRLRAGDAAFAAAEARQAARTFAAIGDPRGEADALRLIGAAEHAGGRLDAAGAALDRAVELAARHGSAVIHAEALRARAELRLDRGARDAARADADHALSILERLDSRADRDALAAWIAERFVEGSA